MPKLINWQIAGNPVNWVIITAIVFFAGMAIAYIWHPANSVNMEQTS